MRKGGDAQESRDYSGAPSKRMQASAAQRSAPVVHELVHQLAQHGGQGVGRDHLMARLQAEWEGGREGKS